MIQIPFATLEHAHIEALLDNKQKENRYLDYKRRLPDLLNKQQKGRREFCADIASFANASGGDIIYGISEERGTDGKPTGIPGRICGLPDFNSDAEINKLTNIAHRWIEPRIAGLDMKPIDGFEGADGPVLVVHIPRSIAPPHVVTCDGWNSPFNIRRSTGKSQMDLSEIRNSFALSADFGEQIRAFRDERLSRISRRQTEVRLDTGPKLALHLFPIASLDPRTLFDVTSDNNDYRLLAPFSTRSGYTPRLNFEGYLIHDKELDQGGGYVQFFRNGVIESVSRHIFSGDSRRIHSTYERDVVKATNDYLAFYRHIGIQPPVFLMLTFLGVKGCKMFANDRLYMKSPPEPMPEDTMRLQDVVIQDLTNDAANILRPAFYHAWHAAGYPRSLINYDENNDWKLRV